MTKRMTEKEFNKEVIGMTSGPYTGRGQVNKMMTGDGRKNFDKMSQDEKMNCAIGIPNKKTRRKNK